MSDPSLRLATPAGTQRQNLRSRVYAVLRDRLHRGEMRPEDRWVDVEIAAQMGVSRMPARDALLQLTHEGYLVGTSRGFKLPSLSLDDMREIFEVRRLLEPRAAAMAAQQRSDATLTRLLAACDRAGQAQQRQDAEDFMGANLAFRQAWIDAVPNRRLAETLQRFVDHVQAVRFGTLRQAAVRDLVMRGLQDLANAFEQRDVLRVQDLMEFFVLNARAAFFASVSSVSVEPEAAELAGLSARKQSRPEF